MTAEWNDYHEKDLNSDKDEDEVKIILFILMLIYLFIVLPIAYCIGAVIVLFCKYVDFSIVFYNLF